MTLACFGGWVAVNPYFRSLGVEADDNGVPIMRKRSYVGNIVDPETEEEELAPDEVSQVLFGDCDLFDPRSFTETGTDHEVVTKRIQRLINKTRVVAAKHG